MTDNQLTSNELATLKDLETVVDKHINSFVEAGNALKEIRDKKLFRKDHKTFEGYMQKRFGLTRQSGWRLLKAVDAVDGMEEVPNSISAAVELGNVAPDKREAVVKQAASNGKPVASLTSSDIKAAAAVIEPKIDEPEDEPEQDDLFQVDDDPADLDAVKANTEHLRKIMENIKTARGQIMALPDAPGYERIRPEREVIARAMDNVISSIGAHSASKICGNCKGARCVKCANLGWLV